MGTIAVAIREYAAEVGVDGQLPADNDFRVLGFEEGELDGMYFNQSTDKMFSFSVSSLEPLKYTVISVNEDLEPSVLTIDQDGIWMEKTE